MTDDEVKTWLSDKEQRAWRIECDESMFIDNSGILRSLAETRKALLSCEWAAEGASGETCPICGSFNGEGDPTQDEPHAPTCIFTTMPRPKL